MELKFKKLHPEAIIPKYQTEGAAGFDLYSIEWVRLAPNEFYAVKTGLAVEVPKGYEMQVRQRSGLSTMYYNYISNSPGTIDSDYRGEIKILVYNHSDSIFAIDKGDRIAQGIISPIIQCDIIEDDLSKTKRGKGGFGSTGK